MQSDFEVSDGGAVREHARLPRAGLVAPVDDADADVPLEEQPTLEELIAFIDAHGGKLGPFRAYRPGRG